MSASFSRRCRPSRHGIRSRRASRITTRVTSRTRREHSPAPRASLRGIPELELVEIPDGEQCCGSAGIYNLIQPESADEIGARKVANVLSTKADLLASANPGCTLQIQKILRESGRKLRAAHPIEILDMSLR